MPNDFNPTYTEAPRFRLPFRSVFMPIVPCVLDGCLSLLELISKLESGSVPLEEMVALHERGMALYESCARELAAFEKRLKASGEEA